MRLFGAANALDALEGFYNPRRRQSALDYKSPNEYERSYALAA